MILPLLFALTCGPGPDGFGLWELQLYKPYNETQPIIVERINTTPGGALRFEVTEPGHIRVCASIAQALDDLAEASEVRRVVGPLPAPKPKPRVARRRGRE